jgi:hypothetical protein
MLPPEIEPVSKVRGRSSPPPRRVQLADGCLEVLQLCLEQRFPGVAVVPLRRP